MLKQCINRTHVLDQRCRTGLVGQREAVDSAKNFSQLGSAAAAYALRLNIVRRTCQESQVDTRPPLRCAVFQHPSGIVFVSRPKFVVVNNCISDGRQRQSWNLHFFNARPK
jgi:hypothetical protein